eukprot:SAG31_NODE_3375_length_4349_cov_1.941176_3_plen_287_part_00
MDLKRDAAELMAAEDYAAAADKYRGAAAITSSTDALVCARLAEYADAASKQWVYLDDSHNQQGPYSLAVIQQWYAAGYLHDDRQVGVLPVLRAEKVSFGPLGDISAIVDPPGLAEEGKGTQSQTPQVQESPQTITQIGRHELVDWLSKEQSGITAAAFPKSRLLDFEWSVVLEKAAPSSLISRDVEDDNVLLEKKEFVRWLSARFDGDRIIGERNNSELEPDTKVGTKFALLCLLDNTMCMWTHLILLRSLQPPWRHVSCCETFTGPCERHIISYLLARPKAIITP